MKRFHILSSFDKLGSLRKRFRAEAGRELLLFCTFTQVNYFHLPMLHHFDCRCKTCGWDVPTGEYSSCSPRMLSQKLCKRQAERDTQDRVISLDKEFHSASPIIASVSSIQNWVKAFIVNQESSYFDICCIHLMNMFIACLLYELYLRKRANLVQCEKFNNKIIQE